MFGQPMTFGFGSQSAPVASPEKTRSARVEDKSTCLPVTVRAIEAALEDAAANDGQLRFHGSATEPAMLILVAAVEVIHSRQGTCLEFSVNDASGRLRARHFAEPGQEKTFDDVIPGRYVSLHGNMRTAPVTHFSVLGFRLLKSADEISYHMLQVAHAALRARRSLGTSVEATPAPKKTRSMVESTTTPPKSQAFGNEEVHDASMTQLEQLTSKPPVVTTKVALQGVELRSALLTLLQSGAVPQPEVGLTASQALQLLKQEVVGGEASISSTFQSLVEEGEVFQTIDDDHYSCLS
jgi:hypothetical protein